MGLPLLAISQLLYVQAQLLWRKEHMQFFPLAFAASTLFFWQEGDSRFQVSKQRLTISKAIVWSGIAICYPTLAIQSSWLANFALVLLVFGWALGKFGNLTVLRMMGICGLLVVAMPPPFDLDKYLVQRLQGLSTVVSTRILDISHFVHISAGNVIEVPSKSLFVEEACSGVDSQYALMAVAGTLLLVGRAGLFVSLLTIVTVPIWALLGNLLRINSIVIGLECFGIDLSAGMKHTVLGLATFSLAAWAHWSSVQFLNFVSIYGRESVDKRSIEKNFDRPAPIRGQFGSVSGLSLTFPGILLLGSVFGLFGNNALSWSRTLELDRDRFYDATVFFPGEGDLPTSVQGRKRVSFNIHDREVGAVFARHSRAWNYMDTNTTQTVSLDLPFVGWHALWECYERTGWTNFGNELQLRTENGHMIEWPFFESQLRNQNGEYAILHFSLFDQNGDPVLYDPGNLGNAFFHRFGRTLFRDIVRTTTGKQSPSELVTFQFQILSRSDEPAADEQRQDFRRMFMEFRSTMREKSMLAIRKIAGKSN